MTTDPTLLTIAEASALFESKKLSPVELTKACIAKTEALDPTLLSYLKFTPETALETAKLPKLRSRAGNRRVAAAGNSDRPQGHLRHRRASRRPDTRG